MNLNSKRRTAHTRKSVFWHADPEGLELLLMKIYATVARL